MYWNWAVPNDFTLLKNRLKLFLNSDAMNILYCIKLALIIASSSLQPLHSPLINQIPGAVYSLYCVCVLWQWCCYLFQNPDRDIPCNYLFLVCITRADNSQTGPLLPLVSLEDTNSNLNLQIPVLRNVIGQRTYLHYYLHNSLYAVSYTRAVSLYRHILPTQRAHLSIARHKEWIDVLPSIASLYKVRPLDSLGHSCSHR